MLKLDLKDPAQKRVLDATLADMDSDSDWDETNPIESAMKKQKLRRYSWRKHEGTEITFSANETGGRHPGNFARDILAKLVRESANELFWHSVPFQDPHTKERVLWDHPFLLPHEVIDGMIRAKGLEYLQMHTGAAAAKLLRTACEKLALQVAQTIALGLHEDGVPYTKKESLEVISLNFLS